MTEYLRPPTTQEAVLTEIRRLIVTGALAPGTPLRQDNLAEMLGVSRVPVREALKHLAGEGQVEYRPHRGYVVALLSIDDLHEVYRLRALLEDEAVRLAIPLLGDDSLAAIDRLAHDVDSASGDVALLTEANRAFHFALYEACGSPRLVRMIRLLWDASDVYRAVYFAEAANRRRIDDEHRAVVDALHARDADKAVALLREHRDHAVAALDAALV